MIVVMVLMMAGPHQGSLAAPAQGDTAYVQSEMITQIGDSNEWRDINVD